MEFKKNLYVNVLTVGGYTYSTQVISFLSSIVISRLLLPSDYGFFALITVFTGFVGIFTNAGFGAAVIRSNYNTTYYKALRNLSLLMGVVIFTIMLLLAYPIAWFYRNSSLVLPIVVFSLVFIFRPLSIVPSAILRKNLNFSYIGKRDLLSSLISVLITIIMAYLNCSYWSLIIPQIFVAILNFYFLELKVGLGYKIYPWQYTIVGYKKTKKLIGSVLGFDTINYWARNADNLIIGKWYGAEELGIYNRAYSLLTLPLNIVSGIFGSVLLPSLTKLKRSGGDINKEYEGVLNIISLLDFPIAFVLIVFPKQLVSFLWGPNWIAVAELLPYFGLLLLTQGLITTIGNIYYLLGKEKTNFYVGAVNAVILVLGIVIGAFYSIVDVARVYALVYLSFNVPINLYFGFVKSFGFDWKFIIVFWVPKVLLSLVILFLLWNKLDYYIPFVLMIYGITIVLKVLEEIKVTIRFFVKKILS
ncbi:lipopolysaccharide biosynthesis protein [Rufibacter hautae]|uniref:lipopolysaccharide biosynthesis protein n=1 Tax=Rufibacter hautae TaxID=2595005 RepID=UPI0016803B5D|nr:lipopolysaccharide biosynthesis protein [Rufibacter hautae]